jgi:hypothetical protein
MMDKSMQELYDQACHLVDAGEIKAAKEILNKRLNDGLKASEFYITGLVNKLQKKYDRAKEYFSAALTFVTLESTLDVAQKGFPPEPKLNEVLYAVQNSNPIMSLAAIGLYECYQQIDKPKAEEMLQSSTFRSFLAMWSI